jgi:hypothetical protein
MDNTGYIPAIPGGPTLPGYSDEDDLAFATGVVRVLAGVAMLAWAILYYTMPLAQSLLSLQAPAGGLAAVAPVLAVAIVKLAGAAVLVWPGLHLLEKR